MREKSASVEEKKNRTKNPSEAATTVKQQKIKINDLQLSSQILHESLV